MATGSPAMVMGNCSEIIAIMVFVLNCNYFFFLEQQLSAMYRQLTKKFISIAVQLPSIAVDKDTSVS